jgi:DNA-binding PadR family transcriptional regulator
VKVLKDRERDILRRTILELLAKGSLHYTEFDKKVCASCHPFATPATFASQLPYLLHKGFIKKESRGVYQITENGKKYLEII